ncbi:hypothetical protein EDD70_2636 [Hydrogenoanaerobacterium saccharovorans]|uniref:Uncharacterized protein n=1 Tax=Hydrogenoanaerobacterium saccharovorans TaxID=474960 RepID=A0A1H8DPX3_9FIRM|nr:hypothetical protein [Hydrogenoanaerobacterium saccharovorans]RPF42295.1 hypothetical protein EDD70_2636 [Hydrogenoanaerobacterium saccharovorans]SEN08567.1 hypothetical protein SAMN05216180_2697 [Hydrogenoanaerobacterium saccharovorans]
MKKGTLISIIIALIAVAGALLGLVAYMRSRRCLECGDVEEDYIPDAEGDYDMEYYVDDQPEAVQPVEDTSDSDDGYVSTPVSADDTEDDDITE